jgi:sialic acid synthase SpsE
MVEVAKKMIESAKTAGADIVKLKMKKVEDYYEDESKKWREFNFIKYRKSLELSKDDFKEINEFCDKIEIPWFATVHDKESRDFISSFDPPFYKVASMDSGKGEFVEDTLRICKSSGKPIVISLGGKSEKEEVEIIDKVVESGVKAFILHCVSLYPTPANKCNIKHMKELMSKVDSDKVRFGYSGHESGIFASVLATVYGAHMIERHLTLTREFKIHHIDAAITPDEFSQMSTIISRIKRDIGTSKSTYETEELDFIEDKLYK